MAVPFSIDAVIDAYLRMLDEKAAAIYQSASKHATILVRYLLTDAHLADALEQTLRTRVKDRLHSLDC